MSNPAEFASANDLGEREKAQAGEKIWQAQMAFSLQMDGGVAHDPDTIIEEDGPNPQYFRIEGEVFDTHQELAEYDGFKDEGFSAFGYIARGEDGAF